MRHVAEARESSLFPERSVPARELQVIRLQMDAELHCTGSFEFPGRWAQWGPGRDPPWGWQSHNYSQLLCFTFSPQHKREGWVTPQTTLESLTTIFNFKQATHKSWRLLLQTQPLGNHCLADINPPVTVKPLGKCNFFIPSPLTFQSRAWTTWSKPRSGLALIPGLSISGNSMGNYSPAVRAGVGEGQFEII